MSSRAKTSGSSAEARGGRRRTLTFPGNRGASGQGLERLYQLGRDERVDLAKQGVPAPVVVEISADMAIQKGKLYKLLGLSASTVNRKLLRGARLDPGQSERVLGIARLIGQVQRIVRESGDPSGFDAAKWLAAWLDQPHPALDGGRPAELMDTAEGREIVSDLIEQQQSGAYA